MASEHIMKRHNKSLLLYHIVCPVKYRRKVFTEAVEQTLKEVCLGISERYEIFFVEIGVDDDHVHFLTQTVPTVLPKNMVQTIKSISGKEIFKRHSEVKKMLWGGHFWTMGYYINTVGQYANEKVIKEYVKNQRKEYKQLYRSKQLSLFDGVP